MLDLSELSLREKIGQTVIALTTPEEYSKYGNEEEFIKRYPVGGFYRAGALVVGKMVSVPDFKKVIEPYRKASRIPLFLTDDFEHGASDNGMKELPYLLALGATENESLAYDYGRVLGMEARRAGLNWLCAPVCDVESTPNPLNDTRDINGNFDTALKLLKQIHQGMRDEGILPTVKHFPSCGFDRDDYHLAPVRVDISANDWMEKAGRFYKGLFASGAKMVMTTHVSLPSMQSEEECDAYGNYKCATVSKEITTGLLKERLGFNGVVVSDGLLMGGLSRPYTPEEMVDCFLSGTDLLMWPPIEYIDVMEQKILDGTVPMERLDDAVSRILTLKNDMGLFEEDVHTDDYDNAFAEDVAERVAKECITLLNNHSGRIPFDRKEVKKVLVVAVASDDTDAEALHGVADAFERRGIEVDFRRDVWMDELTSEKQKEYQMIVFAICRLPHHPAGPLMVYGDNAYSVWTSHTCDKDKMIAVSFGSPWIYKYYRQDDMYINAYSLNPETMESVVAALFEEIPFHGKSPVCLSSDNGSIYV